MMGFSRCRFEGGPPDEEMGSADRTDGTWLWPEGLHVYANRYNIRLPSEFIRHIEANNYSIPDNLDREQLELTPADVSFWTAWCTGIASSQRTT
jgi:hypothetical protein